MTKKKDRPTSIFIRDEARRSWVIGDDPIIRITAANTPGKYRKRSWVGGERRR